MSEAQQTEVTATIRMIGQSMDNFEVPAPLLVRTLDGFQQIVYLLAASSDNKSIGKRFRITNELQQLYTLKCQIPQAGSYSIPISLNPCLYAQLSLITKYDTILENLQNILSGVSENNLEKIRHILPDSKIGNRVLNELRKCLPKAGEGWRLGFLSGESQEVILTDKTIHHIDRWLNPNTTEDEVMTVTGELVRINFDEYTVVIKYPPTNHEIKCFYVEELEDSLIENRRQLIQLTGKFTLNDEGHPNKLTDVTRIEPVDLSTILLKEISFGNVKLRLKNITPIVPYMDEESSQLFVVEEPKIGLFTFAYTREELIEKINEQIVMMWERYAQANPEALAKNAKELKIKLLENLEEV